MHNVNKMTRSELLACIPSDKRDRYEALTTAALRVEVNDYLIKQKTELANKMGFGSNAPVSFGREQTFRAMTREQARAFLKERNGR
jgi:hypothetical protein